MGDYDSDEDGDEVKYFLTYEGETEVFNAVVRDGSASAKFANGDVFVGEYKDGKRNGRGKYTFAANGFTYEGDYVDNKKHGYGSMNMGDKGKYEGDWEKDVRHGVGTYVYPNNDMYTGNWQNGMKHGKGSYTYADIGSKITGVWSNNKCMHGEWGMRDRSSYVGRFSNNVPAGEGLFTFANKNTSSGTCECVCAYV
jgi:radial spoke head protein 1